IGACRGPIGCAAAVEQQRGHQGPCRNESEHACLPLWTGATIRLAGIRHINEEADMNEKAFRVSGGMAARFAACVLAVSAAGCTSVMPPPMASSQNVQSLKAANLNPSNVGTFTLAAGLPAQMDKELSGGLRGSNLAAPSGSYSQHLK